MLIAYLSAGMSIHPHLRALPVVDPNSLPIFANLLPTSSNSSDGKGPLPTRVQYALKIPKTSPISFLEMKPLRLPYLTTV